MDELVEITVRMRRENFEALRKAHDQKLLVLVDGISLHELDEAAAVYQLHVPANSFDNSFNHLFGWSVGQ